MPNLTSVVRQRRSVIAALGEVFVALVAYQPRGTDCLPELSTPPYKIMRHSAVSGECKDTW